MILRAQHLIARLGVADPGPLDGVAGRRTRAAVEVVQKQAGIAPTGEVDLLTLAVLDHGVRAWEPLRITPAQLRACLPRLPGDQHALASAALMEIMGTPLRAAHFFAQVAHESGDGRYAEEIADGDAYEGRADLGNTRRGDGRRFKGRGLIQLTGRANYARAGAYLGLPLEDVPERAATPEVAWAVAAWYWLDRSVNLPADEDDLEGVTRKINGGLNGLKDRATRLERCRATLHVGR